MTVFDRRGRLLLSIAAGRGRLQQLPAAVDLSRPLRRLVRERHGQVAGDRQRHPGGPIEVVAAPRRADEAPAAANRGGLMPDVLAGIERRLPLLDVGMRVAV